ncbi:MAG: hypothetical protein COB59_08025 [Rhodospirillaceae bacterium]|nr:MAG: hypothetical protein COB59_08025 [Rhodospirillaceae bacterium]
MTQKRTARARDIETERTHARALEMAEAIVTAFSGLLKEQIGVHGGFVGLRHLPEVNKVFQSKTGELASVFEKAFNESKREHEDLKWHAIKRPVFDRLMVRHFESLFFRPGPDGIPTGIISRRVLPGFFLALNMMLGPVVIKDYQDRCDEALERVTGGAYPINWEAVEHDEDVNAVVLDAQFTIAHFFDDPYQRAAWFINIINSNLEPAKDGASDADWLIDQRALFKLISHLTADLKRATADDVAWTHLALRHNDADRDVLKAILQKL